MASWLVQVGLHRVSFLLAVLVAGLGPARASGTAAAKASARASSFAHERNEAQRWMRKTGQGSSQGQASDAPHVNCKAKTGRACQNVLYLVSDDMRPQLGAYGHDYMITPHLDGLARTGLQFDFAYTNFAYCAPSRNSFLSGRRPERTRALTFNTDFRKQHGDAWVAMPQFFKNHGYFTSSAGKVYHDGMDDPLSWSHPANQTRPLKCSEGDLAGLTNNFCGVTNVSNPPFTDEDMILEAGLERMLLAHASGRPWWVSIGVRKPHVPYRVPAGFYGTDLYPGDVVTHPKHPEAPSGAPFMSGNWEGGDIRDRMGRAVTIQYPDFGGCRNCTVDSSDALEYRRWYYAAVSWADHSLGRALAQLEAFGPETVARTIVVFHADHGYQLGELNEWTKMTNTELATHVPLLIRVPWAAAAVGQRTAVKAELVDLYRTLAELSGLGSDDVQPDVQGTSLAPVFDAPTNPPRELAQKLAYSQIGRCGCRMYPCHCTDSPAQCHECGLDACGMRNQTLAEFDYMGYSVRTREWRFTVWAHLDSATLRVDWKQPVAVELYDVAEDDGRSFDFDGYSVNLAPLGKHNETVDRLLTELKAAVASWY